MHGWPSIVLENSLTPLHVPHSRSAVSVPTDVCPSPTAHVRHATQCPLPARALNVPAAHVEHCRSDDALGADTSYWPAWHSVTPWQTRSDVTVGAEEVKCPTAHFTRCVLQSRSDVAVGALLSYSLAEHTVTGVHACSLLLAENVTPASHVAH